jgi:hypothetical protein
MESVRGIRIMDYCNQALLTLMERLVSFIKVQTSEIRAGPGNADSRNDSRDLDEGEQSAGVVLHDDLN